MTEYENNKILVIDDNEEIHKDYKEILLKNNVNNSLLSQESYLFGESAKPDEIHFELDSAYQGKDGLKMIQKAIESGLPYALAFVDMRMPPGWNGLETIKRIWQSDPNIEIVICTAYSDISWKSILSDDDILKPQLLILKKPFDLIEVLQLAHTLVQKWSFRKQANLKYKTMQKLVEEKTRELHLAHERLKSSAEKAWAILNATTDSVLLIGPSGEIFDINERAAKMIQNRRDTLLGKCIFDIIPAEYRASFRQNLEKSISSQRPVLFEYTFNKDFFEINIFPICHGHKVGKLVVFMRDITLRKNMQQKILQGQKLESIGQLAAGVAHEINSPVQYIRSNTDFLRNSFISVTGVLNEINSIMNSNEAGAAPDTIRESASNLFKKQDISFLLQEIPLAIDQTLDGITRISKIVNAMQEFSQPVRAEKVLADINNAIKTVITISKHQWNKIARLKTNLDPELPLVPCLLGDLNQVFLNLILNAIHAIEEKKNQDKTFTGAINVSTISKMGQVEIHIQDTGIGIPQSIKERIMDPFFTTKEVGKGMGQGLAIARNIIVNKHNGDLAFETKENEGTTFIISLPAIKPE